MIGRIPAMPRAPGAVLQQVTGFPFSLRDLCRLGLRSAMLVAHNYTNEFADSCCAG